MTKEMRSAKDAYSRSLIRFDVVERVVHWSLAFLFFILIATALPLYFPSIEAIVGRRLLLANIHTWVGIALPIPLVIALFGNWGKGLRSDIGRFNLWTSDEVRWLKSLARDPMVELGKFNPGQKLNALFTGSVISVMLATGIILKWFNFFPLSWRTGATFVHDTFATLFVLVLAGHIFMAVTHRKALRSMLTGRIPSSWAERHAPLWLRESNHESEDST
ncbi:MAG: cytochrome b/b6 domain-containing protein [Actinobacteria bacterium]|jgi:formate dehydrogenase subunit gamma|nr:cytochrome b/b6 domain-containing protein [Actinomycetota bacterium]